MNEPEAARSFETAEPKSWENAWEAPGYVRTALRSRFTQKLPKVDEQPQWRNRKSAAAAKPVEPDMDELVARVSAKMNPDVLQKVTREILRPVIEAIVRDEMSNPRSRNTRGKFSPELTIEAWAANVGSGDVAVRLWPMGR